MKILKTVLLIAIVNLVVLFLVTLNLQDEIPHHLNANMIIDDYASKWITMIIGIIPIITAAGILAVRHIINKRGIVSTNEKVENILLPIIIIFLIVITWTPVVMALRYDLGIGAKVDLPLFFLISFPSGILMIIIGNFLGTIKKNFWMGIRTPWTFASESVWKKTHRLGGVTGVCGGVITCISSVMGLILNSFVVSVIGLLAGIFLIAIIPCIYSYWIYKKEKENER